MANECMVEVKYGKLPEGFNIRKEVSDFMREMFKPITAYQKRHRKQQVEIMWPYFTAVEFKGAGFGGQFQNYPEDNGGRFVVQLQSRYRISDNTIGHIKQGLEKLFNPETTKLNIRNR